MAIAVGAPVDVADFAWNTWTPTYANLTTTGATITARYVQVLKKVSFFWRFNLGSGSAVGSGPTFTLPVAPTNLGTDDVFGQAGFLDATILSYPGMLVYRGSSVAGLVAIDASATYAKLASASASIPFSFGSGDVITAWGTYEAA